MDQVEITASPRLRLAFLVVAALMLLLWGWSLVPPIENWNNPCEDGFSYVRVFYASLICLPAGLFLLIGAIAGHGRHVARARPALFVGVGTLFIGLSAPAILISVFFSEITRGDDRSSRHRYSLAGTMRR